MFLFCWFRNVGDAPRGVTTFAEAVRNVEENIQGNISNNVMAAVEKSVISQEERVTSRIMEQLQSMNTRIDQVHARSLTCSVVICRLAGSAAGLCG